MFKAIMPQEVEVWYIIPAIRKEFANIMVKTGLTQKDVARRLNITEAAVSQYLKSKRASKIDFGKEITDEIKKSVDIVLKKDEHLVLLYEIQRICELAKKDHTLCRIHLAHNEDLPQDCNICFE